MRPAKKHSAEIIFVLSLFLIYTFCALLLSVMGANVYSKNVDDSEKNYNMRTSLLYITEKVRQNESIGNISVGTALGNDALVLSRTIDETVYNTWIYFEDGNLCEVIVPSNLEIVPNMGQKIMSVSAMEFEINDSLLSVIITDENQNQFSSNLFLECEVAVND